MSAEPGPFEPTVRAMADTRERLLHDLRQLERWGGHSGRCAIWTRPRRSRPCDCEWPHQQRAIAHVRRIVEEIL